MDSRVIIDPFNPTLVRLRLVRPPKLRATQSIFQSHAGSIEAIVATLTNVFPQFTFNPTLVRLRLPYGLLTS